MLRRVVSFSAGYPIVVKHAGKRPVGDAGVRVNVSNGHIRRPCEPLLATLLMRRRVLLPLREVGSRS